MKKFVLILSLVLGFEAFAGEAPEKFQITSFTAAGRKFFRMIF